MGLGLAICYTVIQKHGGAIAVESEPGVGTTFRILLPASRKSLQTETAAVPASRPRRGRILVMDDERLVRQLLARMLARLGCEAVGAQDGAEASRLYQEARAAGRPFAAVIMDLTVPGGMGGKEAIGLLRARDPGVRAIVSSGY